MAKRAGFRDTFEEIFGDDPDPDGEKYPGSKKNRRDKAPVTEFVADESWRDTYTTKFMGGKERRFYTVGALAVACGVSTHSVNLWITKGYIPEAPYRLPDMVQPDGKVLPGRRLYTADMVDAVVAALSSRDLLGGTRIPWKQSPDITEEIIRAWAKIKSEDELRSV